MWLFCNLMPEISSQVNKKKQVGGNSLEQTILECNCPLCKALHFSEEHVVVWREPAFVSQRAFLLIFILLVHLSADPTVQSDIQLLQFPQTKTCFEWLLQMSSLKIKQLCCFSSTPLFVFSSCWCFVSLSLWNEKGQTYDCAVLWPLFLCPLLGTANAEDNDIMILILHDIIDHALWVCVHGQDRVCIARMNLRWC